MQKRRRRLKHRLMARGFLCNCFCACMMHLRAPCVFGGTFAAVVTRYKRLHSILQHFAPLIPHIEHSAFINGAWRASAQLSCASQRYTYYVLDTLSTTELTDSNFGAHAAQLPSLDSAIVQARPLPLPLTTAVYTEYGELDSNAAAYTHKEHYAMGGLGQCDRACNETSSCEGRMWGQSEGRAIHEEGDCYLGIRPRMYSIVTTSDSQSCVANDRSRTLSK